MTDLKIEIENRLQTLEPLRLKGEHGNYTEEMCEKTRNVIYYSLYNYSNVFIFCLCIEDRP